MAQIEIGKNLHDLLKRAGNLNEKWEDLKEALELFLKSPDIKGIAIEKSVSGEGSSVGIIIRKIYREVESDHY